MTYPNSSDVSSGQPTASTHYNNLRKDALYLGQAAADSLTLGAFMAHFAQNIKLQYLATNRIRAAFDAYRPATVMLGGCMLKAVDNIDLPAGQFSGAAALYYIHAIRTAGSTAFTLSVNTSLINTDTSRPIGTCYWDGSAVTNIVSWYQDSALPTADYDSDWFSVAYNNTYSKDHHLGAAPRLVMVLHSANSDGSGESVPVFHVNDGTTTKSPLGVTTSAVILQTANNASQGCCYSIRRLSGSGYYRIFAWL